MREYNLFELQLLNNIETYHFSLILRMMFETSKHRVTFLSLVFFFFVKSLNMLQQATVLQPKINYTSLK